MSKDKKTKKKCCGKFEKKGKHCSSCPVTGGTKDCKPSKEYCKDCDVPDKSKTEKKSKKKKKKK